jgi:hypothetical protein
MDEEREIRVESRGWWHLSGRQVRVAERLTRAGIAHQWHRPEKYNGKLCGKLIVDQVEQRGEAILHISDIP